MRIALIGIGKIANYQMQAINHTKGFKLVDALLILTPTATHFEGALKVIAAAGR